MHFGLKLLVLPMLAVVLAACDFVGMVGNPKTGFTFRFPDKWRFDQSVSSVPQFVNQADRYACEVDKCGRRAVGIGVYGNLRAVDGGQPRYGEIVAALDALLNFGGKLKAQHVNEYPIAGQGGYRVRFAQPAKNGELVLFRGSMVFHGDRFLLMAVTTNARDETLNTQLLDELEGSLKVPAKVSARR